MEYLTGKKGEEAVAECERQVRKGTPYTLDRVEGANAVDADTVAVDVKIRLAGYVKPSRLTMIRDGGRWKLDVGQPK